MTPGFGVYTSSISRCRSRRARLSLFVRASLCLMLTGSVLSGQIVLPPEAKGDAILRAMVDENNRSRDLRMMVGAPLYYLYYNLSAGDGFLVSYSLGALIRKSENTVRVPVIRARVGSYELDDSNFVASGIYQGTRFDAQSFPADIDYPLMRRYWWLLTDMEYKGSVQALNLKKASMRNLQTEQGFPDYTPAEPTVKLIPGDAPKFDKARWDGFSRSLSEIFLSYPSITDSQVVFGYSRGVEHVVNTEGTVVRRPFAVAFLRVTARARTAENADIWDGEEFLALEESQMPAESAIRSAISRMAENLVARAAAPKGENYLGPVLFEGRASAQLVAQLIGRQLWIPRKPISVPNRPLNWPRMELEGRVGSRIVSENLTVRDDPTLSSFDDQPLIGNTQVDLEGVKPAPLTVIEDGRLVQMFRTRTPSLPGESTNGRARLFGVFAANRGAASNLIVEAKETIPETELKTKLIEMVKASGKPYGILVRKLDFPSSGDTSSLRSIFSGNATNTGKVPVSIPLSIFRVYPDGREEMIRDVNFREIEIRALRDVVAGDRKHVFHFLENGLPFAPMGAGTYVAETSVISPSLLVEEAELETIRLDRKAEPLVDPPPFATDR